MSIVDNNSNNGLIGTVEKTQPIPQWQSALLTGCYWGTTGLEGLILTGQN